MNSTIAVRFNQLIVIYIYNKRVRPTKNEPQQQGISYLERKREWVRERERGGRAGRNIQGKVRFGRDRDIMRHRNKEA